MKLTGLVATALLVPTVAQAGEAGDILTQHLYAGTLVEGQAALLDGAMAKEPEACFGWAFLKMAAGLERFAQDLYKYGATTPQTPAAAMLLGMAEMTDGAAPANPNPEKLTYAALRSVLEDFRDDIAEAQASFECPASATADFVVPIRVLDVRIDFDGNGTVADGETLGAFLAPLIGDFTPPHPEKVKGGTPQAKVDSTIGFDVADSVWLAGYTEIVHTQLNLILAHDFEAFYNAYLHRIFPHSGLPMQDYSTGGTLLIDPESDSGIADIIAAIHTLNFPVIDQDLFRGIPAQLHHITALSRRNWELIMAETDDNRELLPNPTQTSMVPDADITPESVAAWRETLDVLDAVIDGQLLIPHWRFKQGFDLKAFFDTSTRTDLVMLLTGLDALPYLKDGPIADAESFAAANAVFGDEVFNYALWFN